MCHKQRTPFVTADNNEKKSMTRQTALKEIPIMAAERIRSNFFSHSYIAQQ